RQSGWEDWWASRPRRGIAAAAAGGRHAERRRVLRVGEPQARQAGVPVPGEPLPDAAAGAGDGRHGAGAGAPRPRRAALAVALAGAGPGPHPLLGVPGRLRRHRVRDVAAQAGVPGGLRLLQAPRQLPRALRHLHGAHAPHQRRRLHPPLPRRRPGGRQALTYGLWLRRQRASSAGTAAAAAAVLLCTCTSSLFSSLPISFAINIKKVKKERKIHIHSDCWKYCHPSGKGLGDCNLLE
ncbi:3-ketoacyl-CoA synthase, partial [Zea mays]